MYLYTWNARFVFLFSPGRQWKTPSEGRWPLYLECYDCFHWEIYWDYLVVSHLHFSTVSLFYHSFLYTLIESVNCVNLLITPQNTIHNFSQPGFNCNQRQLLHLEKFNPLVYYCSLVLCTSKHKQDRVNLLRYLLIYYSNYAFNISTPVWSGAKIPCNQKTITSFSI
jgi:hypothetical protein